MVQASTSGYERKKVNVEMEIKSAQVIVLQPEELRVTWARSTKSLTTKGYSVDEQTKVATFRDKYICDASLRQNTSTDEWLSDENKLTLTCG